ncbi:MAG: hypothetical protein LBG57_02800 [Treponema sp.]|jgi:hypothetical protein|nr:hypothetical protein [Treponema sp.]
MTSINSAFRLRNRLKERIQYLSGLIKDASYQRNKGEEENCAELDGKTLQAVISETAGLMDLLCEFNHAIDKANEVNRDDLTTLETIKAKINLYTGVTEQCRKFKGYDYEYPEDRKDFSTDMVKVLKELNIDQKAMVGELESLKKEKDKLEEQLSRRNYETKVEFDTGRIQAVF